MTDQQWTDQQWADAMAMPMTEQERADALAYYDKIVATVPAHQLLPYPPNCWFVAVQNGQAVSLRVMQHPYHGPVYLILPPWYAIFGTLIIETRCGATGEVIARHEVVEDGLQRA